MHIAEVKEKMIDTAVCDQWKVCVYGLGYLGHRLYRLVPELFGLSADFFCDGDEGKVDSTDLPGIMAIHKKELVEVKESFLVFVLVDSPTDRVIAESLSCNPNLHVVTVRELIQMDSVIRSFYGDEFFVKYVAAEDYSRRNTK